MDKRLAKRHKRQVARAKEKVKVSEPDVRTPEQIKADREASHPDHFRATPTAVGHVSKGVRNPASSTGSSPKTAA